MRDLGQLRRAKLHRKHTKSLHDIRRSVSCRCSIGLIALSVVFIYDIHDNEYLS